MDELYYPELICHMINNAVCGFIEQLIYSIKVSMFEHMTREYSTISNPVLTNIILLYPFLTYTKSVMNNLLRFF